MNSTSSKHPYHHDPNVAVVSDDTIPLSVFLVKSDCNEEKLLFRFPYIIEDPSSLLNATAALKRNKYALLMPPNKQEIDLPTAGIDDQPASATSGSGNPAQLSGNLAASAFLPSFAELISSSTLTLDANDQDEISKVIGITDSTFSNLFGVLKSKLCGQKFELKVDNVRFVGHPSQLADMCFHVVFALKANAPNDVVNCYHDLSKRIATALKSEEQRCSYFSKETKIMARCHDEISNSRHSGQPYRQSPPYSSILERSMLAKNLQDIFKQLLHDGLVHVLINNLVNIDFCLPQKVHRKLVPTLKTLITPDSIQECLRRLRPYHTFLLLVNAVELVESLPPDVSSPVICLIKMSSPLKNMIELSADAGITLSQTFNVVAQLVYWGKATIIFPICETNVYVLHPSATTDVDSPLVGEFEARFAKSLHIILSTFSLGVSLSQLRNPMDSLEQAKEWVRIIEWMLQKRLLMQLHTYVVFFPLGNGSPFLQQQRLSFTQSNPSCRGDPERPPSSSTAELNDCSTIASSYQSESSIVLGASPSTSSTLGGYTSSEQLLYAPPGSSLRDSLIIRGGSHISALDGGPLELLNGNKNANEAAEQQHLKESAELILRENLSLSNEEINAILSTPSAGNIEDIKLFVKLCPYFDGHHHIEDMMHYENLRRGQIQTLVDKFSDVLLVYQYEDTTVDKLQPYNTL